MDFDRLNHGVFNQVAALVSEVGKFVYQYRTLSPVDWTKMRPTVDRLLDRIYQSDIPCALTASQATALYRAAGSIEVAYLFTLQQPWGGATEQKYEPFEAIRLVKATFKDPCEKVAEFWREMDTNKKRKDTRQPLTPEKVWVRVSNDVAK